MRGTAIQSPVTRDPVELAAAEIRHVARVGALQVAIQVGEIVFHRIYDRDLELFRKKGPKHVAFGRLVAREDLGISRANLWRAVAIYELAQRIPTVTHGAHIGLSHVRLVLGLPEAAQERLLTRADREQLSVAALDAAVTTRRRGQGGRPRKPEVLRVIDTLIRVAAVPLDAFSDERALAKMSKDDVQCAVAMLEDLEHRIGELRALLHKPSSKS